MTEHDRSTEPATPGTATKHSDTLAQLLDRVRWEYDPERDDVTSPLITTERFFRDFPWQGRDTDG